VLPDLNICCRKLRVYMISVSYLMAETNTPRCEVSRAFESIVTKRSRCVRATRGTKTVWCKQEVVLRLAGSSIAHSCYVSKRRGGCCPPDAERWLNARGADGVRTPLHYVQLWILRRWQHSFCIEGPMCSTDDSGQTPPSTYVSCRSRYTYPR
jgi:hypothetical protein